MTRRGEPRVIRVSTSEGKVGGRILQHSECRFEAFDPAGQSLGIFPCQMAATRAFAQSLATIGQIEFAFHPLADMLPLMEGDEFAVLVADIRAHGLHELITLFEGKILEGRNRFRACRAAGRKPRYRAIEFGSWDAARDFVISANIHRRHLTTEQRRELIEKLLKADPTQSDRRIAKTTRVSDKTVGAVRKDAERRAEIPHVEKRIDSKGRKQPRRRVKSRASPKPPAALTDQQNVGGRAVQQERPIEEVRAAYAALDDSTPPTTTVPTTTAETAPTGADGPVHPPTVAEPIDPKIDWRGARRARLSPKIVRARQLAALRFYEKRVSELDALRIKWHREALDLKAARVDDRRKIEQLQVRVDKLETENQDLRGKADELEAQRGADSHNL
jgi:hypothetical protein